MLNFFPLLHFCQYSNINHYLNLTDLIHLSRLNIDFYRFYSAIISLRIGQLFEHGHHRTYYAYHRNYRSEHRFHCVSRLLDYLVIAMSNKVKRVTVSIIDYQPNDRSSATIRDQRVIKSSFYHQMFDRLFPTRRRTRIIKHHIDFRDSLIYLNRNSEILVQVEEERKNLLRIEIMASNVYPPTLIP